MVALKSINLPNTNNTYTNSVIKTQNAHKNQRCKG